MRWALVGVSAKMFRQNIDSYQEDGIGMDLGLLSRTPIENLRAGVSLLNIGGSGNAALPLTMLLGADYETGRGLTVAGDLRIPRDNVATLHLGVEYALLSALSLRGGINTRSEEGAGGNYSLGLGLHIKTFSLDYAYVPYAELGDTHRAGVKLDF
jgi:hypothetical protein